MIYGDGSDRAEDYLEISSPLLRYKGLPWIQKLVLADIIAWDKQYEEGGFSPFVKTNRQIAASLGIAEPTAQLAVHELHDRGFIKKEEMRDAYTGRLYRAMFPTAELKRILSE